MRLRKLPAAAFSMIEVLVAMTIMVIISGGIYSVLSSTRNVAELAQAKEEAKSAAEIVLKHMQHDIAISQAKVDKLNLEDGKPKVIPSLVAGGSNVSMMVPKAENADAMADDYVEVAYSLAGNKLYRKDGRNDTTRLLSSNVSKLDVFMLSDDQVSVEIETSVLPRGQKEPVKHNQKILVTIREAVANYSDKRWLTSEEAVVDY